MEQSIERRDPTLKLKELELSTQYELKYLASSFADLKAFVENKLTTEADRFQALTTRVTWLTVLIVAQLAGVDADLILSIIGKFFLI